MDYKFLQIIQNSRIKELDSFFQLISEQTTSITIGVISAFIFLGLLFKQHKKMTLIGLKILVVILFNAMLIIVLKSIFDRARPFEVHPEIIKLSNGGSPSFPSGHTAEVFALAFSMLFILKNRWAFYLFLIWACLIAYSRIALGVHYPFNVFFGALNGIGMAFLVNWLFEKYLPDVSPIQEKDK